MHINVDYDFYTSQQYHMKNLESRIRGFESGEIYQKMQLGQKRQRHYYEQELAHKDKKIAQMRKQEQNNLKMWFEVFEDIQQESDRRASAYEKQLKKEEERALKAERRTAELEEKLRQKTEEVVQARAETQKEKEKNQNLQAQLHRDFKNSSQPSSQTNFRGKVTNNREKSDRKPGAQPGHEWHGRKKHAVNGGSVFIPAPEEIENDPEFYRQEGEHSEVHKQAVSVRLVMTVTDYWSYTYRNRRTGAKYHPPFPDNVRLDVNYDSSVKALVFLMKNHLNVPENKIREFFYEMTDGEICLSRGLINGMNREFSEKTEKERNDIFARLATSEVLSVDMTGARRNGKMKNIVVCTNGEDLLYFFRDTKGDKALEGTPVEIFTNTLLHDHDKTFYHYGGAHQECNEHHLRYLKGAQENEPDLTWHGKMRSLLQEMNRVRENIPGRMLTQEQIDGFEKRYDELVDLAKKEYYDHPPSMYYRKGYNLSVEFREYRESILYFLRHPEVDFTNNVSERACRKAKRHQAVSGTFRGGTNQSGSDYCDAMGVMQTERAYGKNIYQTTREMFDRKRPPKIKDKNS